MSRYRPQSRDTSVDVEQRLVARYREMSPAQKLEIFRRLCRTSQELAAAGIQRRDPQATRADIENRLAAMRLPPEARHLLTKRRSGA